MWDTKMFKREIQALRRTKDDSSLHALNKGQVKQRILSAIAAETTPAAERYSWHERKLTAMKYIVSILLGLSLVGGTAFAANNAHPGDAFFPVKKAAQRLQVKLAVSEQARAKLEARFAEERLHDLEQADARTMASEKRKESEASSSTPLTLHASTTVDVNANTEAKAEVSNAINRLNEVKVKLEAKGNSTAAAAINKTIIRLQAGLNATQHTGAAINNHLDFNESSSNATSTEMNKTIVTPSGTSTIHIKSEASRPGHSETSIHESTRGGGQTFIQTTGSASGGSISSTINSVIHSSSNSVNSSAHSETHNSVQSDQ